MVHAKTLWAIKHCPIYSTASLLSHLPCAFAKRKQFASSINEFRSVALLDLSASCRAVLVLRPKQVYSVSWRGSFAARFGRSANCHPAILFYFRILVYPLCSIKYISLCYFLLSPACMLPEVRTYRVQCIVSEVTHFRR